MPYVQMNKKETEQLIAERSIYKQFYADICEIYESTENRGARMRRVESIVASAAREVCALDVVE